MEILSPEEWRAISEAPNYEVSSLGRVRSLYRFTVSSNGRVSRRYGRLLRPALLKSGYFQVVIRGDNNKPMARCVHVLVARAFIGEPESEKMQVNHKNLNKQDNTPGNLEYMTQLENLQHYHRSRRLRMGLSDSVLTDENIREIRFIYNTGRFTQNEIGKAYGIASGYVSIICSGKMRKDAKTLESLAPCRQIAAEV